jgi:hypothetical protein
MRKRQEEMFKLDNQITWYLKDHEDDLDKQRKIVERANSPLFYAFHREGKNEEDQNQA